MGSNSWPFEAYDKKKGLTESSKMQKLTNMKTPWNEFKMVNM